MNTHKENIIDPDTIKYLIQKFEEKIRNNPLTPEFVKLANYYIINGNTSEAIDLLKAGLNFYPNYTTAKLVLGKAYLANRYFVDAKKIFDEIILEYPGLNIALKYSDICNEMLKNEVSRKYEDDLIPKLEFKAPEFSHYDYSYNLFPSYELEDFEKGISADTLEDSNEFKEFTKIFKTPDFFRQSLSVKNIEKRRLKNKFEFRIITETLADIFARQGHYFDAIEAYSYLLKIKPERKEIIESKINEVEVKINRLINDF
ncbi:MAG: tetratricopeptide repeat protein [Ignavibacteria bacterium]|nr:tetratricopeptide repeat protein [Ignavibacteria bacterium]